MKDIRKRRLEQLIRTRYKGVRADFMKETGLSGGRVTQLLNPADAFGERAARELERKLDLPAMWFDKDDHNNTEPVGRPLTRGVPLISWIQAGSWNEASDPYAPGEAETWVPSLKATSKSAYALRVRGDSMMSPYGKTYPPGSIVIVEPERRSPVNGERVIAKLLGSQEVVFKVYKEEDGRKWLAPLNQTHPAMAEPFEILGTVIGKWEDD
jgi:SOS-response transcriptional repressor LexA